MTLTPCNSLELFACPVTHWSRIVLDPAHHAEGAVEQFAESLLDAEREVRAV